MFANCLVNVVRQFKWGKLDFLDARFRPIVKLDKRLPFKAQGRTMHEYRAGAPVVEKLSLLRGNRVPIIKNV